ncbi:MAG TPA: GNAT family N-acetyltransferase [Sediminibacterium sp.]|nr:GNAT family N-acetyltransferase [Sediminibacterium sp.]
MHSIRLIPAEKIDPFLWDRRVASSEDGLIYSCMDYLNAVCENWMGLVLNNYEVVMALPFKSKPGFRYWYTPPFVQQLGFVGLYNLPAPEQAQLMQEMISLIVQQFTYGSLLLNHCNTAAALFNGVVAKPNYTLDLHRPYQQIYNGYSADLKQNIRKAKRAAPLYCNAIPIETAIELFMQHHAHQSGHIRKKQYRAFTALCIHVLAERKQCFTRSVLNSRQEIESVALLLKDGRRIYNLMNTTTAAGRQNEANHFLLDQLIQEFAEDALLLDFEGSAIPGVQSFYRKFGAAAETYYLYHYNRLPFPLSLLK